MWRTWLPLTALEKSGYPCGWDFMKNDAISAIAPAFDGYQLARTSWPATHRKVAEAWFASIRRAGKFVVYDADDDVFSPQETHRRVDLEWTEGKSVAELDEERHQRIWALQQCDGATVTTQRLATIVRQYTDKPVVVVPNAIDLVWFRKVQRAAPRIVPGLTVGWAGGRRHDRDVEQMAEAWGRIARRFPDVTFVVQGWHPEVITQSVPSERLVKLPWMKPEHYPSGLKQMDIQCCALADTPFNRAKSPIKVFEAAASGAAVVASPTLYESVVEDGVSGMIARTVDEWESGLAELVTRPAGRSMMARRLLRTVERRHSLAGNLWRWVDAWAQIEESARTRRLVAV